MIVIFASEAFLNGDNSIVIPIPIDSKIFVTIKILINVLKLSYYTLILIII